MTKLIDCKGLKCPAPVINTKKYFDSIDKGDANIIVDNEVAKNNICKLAEKSNLLVKNIKEENNLFNIELIKEDSCSCLEEDSSKNKLAVVVSKNVLGSGDDKLGTALMKSYLYALSESDKLPTDVVFLNGGVKLTTEGSNCIESIQSLKDKGVNIVNCGTCLDFYGLKDKLKIGEISNMYSIVEIMNSADNTIFI